MAEHELKTWPAMFDAVKSGAKSFELRKNDRGFNVGDVLLLRKWDPETDDYVKEPPLRREVTFILWGPAFGLPTDMVVMSLERVEGSYGFWKRQASAMGVKAIEERQRLSKARSALKRISEHAGRVTFEHGHGAHAIEQDVLAICTAALAEIGGTT